MLKKDSEIIQAYKFLRDEVHNERNLIYEKLVHVYEGEYDELETGRKVVVPGTDEVKELGQQQVVANVLNEVVNHNQALIATSVEIQMVAPPPGDNASQEKANKQEKILYGYWHTSEMVRQLAKLGWWMSALGTAVIMVTLDMNMKSPRIVARSPAITYPEFKSGTDNLSFCMFGWKDRSSKVSHLMETSEKPSSHEVEVLEYIDENKRRVYVDGKRVRSINHNWGFIPIMIVPNLLVPEKEEGHSDIEQAVGLNQYMNRLYNLEGRALEENLFPEIMVREPLSSEIASGPGAVIPVGPGGDVKKVPGAPTPPNLQAQLDRSLNYIRMNTGFQPTEQGFVPGSIVTGPAVSKLRAPVGTRVDLKHGLLGAALSKINEYCFRIDEKEFKGEEKEVWGVDGGSLVKPRRAFRQSYIPDKDIDGWYKNVVIWSPFGADLPTRMINMLQYQGQGIFSKRFVAENTPGVQDYDEIKRQIEEEKMEEVAFQAKMAQAQQGIIAGMAPQGPPGDAEAAQFAMERGGQPQAGPPGAPPGLPVPGPIGAGPGVGPNEGLIPGAPPGMAPGPGIPPGPGMPPLPGAPGIPLGGPPLGGTAPAEEEQSVISLDEVVMAMSTIKKLKGDVYVTGEIVALGETSGDIELSLTNAIDKQTILNALPQFHGRIRFEILDEGDQPEGESVEVSPGMPTKMPKPNEFEEPGDEILE